jgi:hypothetical protein
LVKISASRVNAFLAVKFAILRASGFQAGELPTHLEGGSVAILVLASTTESDACLASILEGGFALHPMQADGDGMVSVAL